MPNLVRSSRFSNVKSNAPFHSPELNGQNGGALLNWESLLDTQWAPSDHTLTRKDKEVCELQKMV